MREKFVPKKTGSSRSFLCDKIHKNAGEVLSSFNLLANYIYIQTKKFEISWSVVDRARDFDPVNKKCRLCLKEKYHIIFQPSGATLNQRSELFSTCRHRLRKTLANT